MQCHLPSAADGCGGRKRGRDWQITPEVTIHSNNALVQRPHLSGLGVSRLMTTNDITSGIHPCLKNVREVSGTLHRYYALIYKDYDTLCPMVS